MSFSSTNLDHLVGGAGLEEAHWSMAVLWDGSADVGDESTSGVLVHDADRVMVVWQDHFQAGLFAELILFEHRRDYDAALEEQRLLRDDRT